MCPESPCIQSVVITTVASIVILDTTAISKPQACRPVPTSPLGECQVGLGDRSGTFQGSLTISDLRLESRGARRDRSIQEQTGNCTTFGCRSSTLTLSAMSALAQQAAEGIKVGRELSRRTGVQRPSSSRDPLPLADRSIGSVLFVPIQSGRFNQDGSIRTAVIRSGRPASRRRRAPTNMPPHTGSRRSTPGLDRRPFPTAQVRRAPCRACASWRRWLSSSSFLRCVFA